MTNQLPGREAGRTITDREISYGGVPLEYHAGGAVMNATKSIDGSNTGYTYEMRAGTPLGRITATGLVAPCRRTTVSVSTETSSAAGNLTWFTVTNAAFFKIGDVIDVQNATTFAVIHNDLTITDVNYTTNRIKVNDNVNVTSGQLVVGTDGTETCIGFLGEFIRLRNADNTADQDKAVTKMAVGGVLNQSYLLGDIAAIVADTTSANRLRGRLKIFNPSTNNYTL